MIAFSYRILSNAEGSLGGKGRDGEQALPEKKKTKIRCDQRGRILFLSYLL